MSRKAKPAPKTAAPARNRLAQLSAVPAVPADSRRLTAVLSIVGFVLLGAVGLSYLQPTARLWGLHHLAFLSFSLALAFVVIAALLWTPLGAALVKRLIARTKLLANRPALLWVLPVMLICWLLSVSAPLLGDGQLWITELSWVGKFETRGEDAPPDRWRVRKEPLEILLHEAALRAILPFRPAEPIPASPAEKSAIVSRRSQWLFDASEQIYRWLSIAAGALTLYVALRFARRRLPPLSRAPFLLTLFSGGGILLFFGYIEHYSWISFAVILFLLAGLDDLFTARRFPWRTLLAFVFALSCHLAAVFLLPALCFLILVWKQASAKPDSAAPPSRYAWMVIASFAVLGVAGYVWVKGWKGWLSVIPLLPSWSRDGYALFTARHALDLLNLLLLAAAPAIVLLMASPRITSGHLSDRIQKYFLLLASVCGVAFALTFDPNLGMARDWDLLALALWPLCLWAAWTVARADWGAARPRLLAAIAGFVVLITLPYVLVQADQRASIRRFETLLNLDLSRSAYGWENLASYCRTNGDIEGRIRALRMACSVDRNPRYRINLAAALRMTGRLAEAETLCVAAVREKPEFANQLVYLAVAYGQSGQETKAHELLQLAKELNPGDSTASLVLRDLDRATRAKSPAPPE